MANPAKWKDLDLKLQQEMVSFVECIRAGMSCDEAADATGVNTPRFYRYVHKYPELNEMYKKAWEIRRAIAVHEAENALLKRVRGYTKKKTKRIQHKDSNGNVVRETVEQEAEEIGPDIKAIEIFLRARVPEEWHAAHKIETTVNVNQQATVRVNKMLEILDDNQAMQMAALFLDKENGQDDDDDDIIDVDHSDA